MATLFERLTGIGLQAPGDRIPIHSFIAAVNEYGAGVFTAQQIIAAFSLDAPQQTAVQSFLGLLTAAPNKLKFIRVFKDCCYLAETGYAYTTQSALVARLQDEVVAQGGTLP